MVEVGERLRDGERVLLDLGALPAEAKRRMLDACAGLVYGFDASMTRTVPDRYLLEPSGAADSGSKSEGAVLGTEDRLPDDS